MRHRGLGAGEGEGGAGTTMPPRRCWRQSQRESRTSAGIYSKVQQLLYLFFFVFEYAKRVMVVIVVGGSGGFGPF